MNEFTPGPWKVVEEDTFKLNMKYRAIHALTLGEPVAHVETWRDHPKVAGQALANAQAISAVPDLVEALEAFMLYTGAPPVDQYCYDNLWEDAWKKGKKAFAKVKGESSITK